MSEFNLKYLFIYLVTQNRCIKLKLIQEDVRGKRTYVIEITHKLLQS